MSFIGVPLIFEDPSSLACHRFDSGFWRCALRLRLRFFSQVVALLRSAEANGNGIGNEYGRRPPVGSLPYTNGTHQQALQRPSFVDGLLGAKSLIPVFLLGLVSLSHAAAPVPR